MHTEKTKTWSHTIQVPLLEYQVSGVYVSMSEHDDEMNMACGQHRH